MEEHSTITNCFCVLIPKLTYKYTYFIWFLLGALLRKAVPDILGLLILGPIKNNGNDDGGQNYNENEISPPLESYLDILLNITSDLLTGIFLLIFKNSERKSNATDKSYPRNSLKINFIFNDETRRAPRFYKLIALISFIDLICQSVFLIKNIIITKYYSYSKEKELNPSYLYSLLIVDISARYFFSRFILNTFFYAHHKLSFILILFALPILAFIDVKQIIEYSFNNELLFRNLLVVCLAVITYILYSFEDIMDKVALETLFIIPNSLLFYKGLFQLVPFVIITIVCRLCNLINFNIKSINKIEKKLLIKASFIPFNILRNIHLVKVIDRFSAQHISHLRILENLMVFIFVLVYDNFFDDNFIDKNEEKLKWKAIYYILGGFALLILLLSSLIHNEIIIINCQVFREKTHYFLGKDAIKEQDSLFDGDSESRDITSSTISNLYSDVSSNY